MVWRIQARGLQEEFARVNRPEQTEAIPLLVLKQNSGNTRVLLLRQNVVREEGDPRRVEITGDVALVRLVLELGVDSYDRYKGALQTATGQNLASVEDLKAKDEDGAQFVVINIPTKFLTRGDYQLRLTGVSSDGRATDLGIYPFHVVTR